MKKNWKQIVIFFAQFVMFYLFPLTAGPTDIMGMVVILIVSAFLFGIWMGSETQSGKKFLYPFAVAGMFVPTVWIYYNESALIHAVWYFVVSMAGVLIGSLIRFFTRGEKK